MFTSEPSLAQRIERMIDATPIVDVHSRIDPHYSTSADLVDLIHVGPLWSALQGVGYPGDLLDPDRPESERLAEVLPYLRQVRTTAVGWCFHRILRDLYDFTDPELTVENLSALRERFTQAAADPAWPEFVLQKRARLTQVVTNLPTAHGQRPTAPLLQAGLVTCRLDMTLADPGDTDGESIRRAVFAQLDEQIEEPVRFTCLSGLVDPAHPILAAVLRWHDLHEAPLQVVVTHPSALMEAIAHHQTARLCALVNLADGQPLADWDGLMAQRPNLAVGALLGAGSGVGLIPSRLEARTLDWVERFPATRIMGFASGMPTAEWTYGAYVLARRATAAALSRAVVGGYFEEDEVPPLCRAIFHDAPRNWLRLGD